MRSITKGSTIATSFALKIGDQGRVERRFAILDNLVYIIKTTDDKKMFENALDGIEAIVNAFDIEMNNYVMGGGR